MHLGQFLIIVNLTFQNMVYTLYAFERNIPDTFQPREIFVGKSVSVAKLYILYH